MNCKKFNVIFGNLSEKIVQIFGYSSETMELIELPRNDDNFTIFSLANGGIQNSNWFKQRRGEKLIKDSIPDITEKSLLNVLR